MALGDILTKYLPAISKSTYLLILTIFVVFIFLMIIFGIAFYFIYTRLQYSRKITIYKKIDGRITKIKGDRARLISLGESGDQILLTRKTKKYLPNPNIQTGANEYWYYIREDDEWINIGIEDIDEHMRQVKAHFLDKEMRYARAGLQKNLKDRFIKPPGFFAKYGAQIMVAIFLLILLILMYFLFDKFVELTGSISGILERIQELLKTVNDLLVKSENIRSGGGLVPA